MQNHMKINKSRKETQKKKRIHYTVRGKSTLQK